MTPTKGHAKALRWIVGELDRLAIPFQAAGGLAARGHGAHRPLRDLDFYIPTSRIHDATAAGSTHVVRPPEPIRTEHWDLTFMKIVYAGCDVELCGADNARYFDQRAQRWRSADVDFARSVDIEILGVTVPTMPLDQLLRYKSALGREVDRQDIEQIAAGRAEIRPARAEDADDLTRLAHASKASWGYPSEWLQEWEPELTITAEWIRSSSAFVAESQGRLVGMIGVGISAGGPEIAHLWIAPDGQGRGLGRTLVEKALEVAVQKGWPSLRILSDPHAQAFYERLGAVRVGSVPAPVPGNATRTLPLLRLDV